MCRFILEVRRKGVNKIDFEKDRVNYRRTETPLTQDFDISVRSEETE